MELSTRQWECVEWGDLASVTQLQPIVAMWEGQLHVARSSDFSNDARNPDVYVKLESNLKRNADWTQPMWPCSGLGMSVCRFCLVGPS